MFESVYSTDSIPLIRPNFNRNILFPFILTFLHIYILLISIVDRFFSSWFYNFFTFSIYACFYQAIQQLNAQHMEPFF